MINESGVSFYPGGGHNHDGENSTLINTSVYSVYDFPVQITGDPSRTAEQIRNLDSFKQLIIDTVNQSIIAPSGIVFQQGIVNGSAHIISRSISTETIAADAITANEIAAGTITADLLAANFVLVNNIISSNNYVTGVSGWAINGNGTAEFDSAMIRGEITADSLYINNRNYWIANGEFAVGDENSYMFYNGNALFLSGSVVATSGAIGNWTITNTDIYNNTGVSNTVLGANGFISAGTLKIGNNDIADAEDIVATNIIRGGRLEATTKAGVVYTGTQANSNSTGDFGFSFYYNGTNVYARLTDTANNSHFDVCLTNCGAGAPVPGPAVGGPPDPVVGVSPDPVVGVSPAVNCTSCVPSGTYTSGAGCGGGACFQTWTSYTCSPANCVGCNCPDTPSGFCSGPACP
jgi:hypothetical protein